MFDIHKIKPIHGWREFWGEVGIIVLGVLIALGAEQIVEWVHWRHAVHQTYGALAVELGDAEYNAVERVRTNVCVNRYLDHIAALLATADRTGRLPPIGSIGYPPARIWSEDVWTGAVNGELTQHFSSNKRFSYSVLYTTIRQLGAIQAKEVVTWSELSSLIGPGSKIDVGSVIGYRKLVSEARFYNRFTGLAGAQFIQRVSSDSTVDIDHREANTMRDTDISKNGSCQFNSGGPASAFGEAPWARAQQYIQATADNVSRHR